MYQHTGKLLKETHRVEIYLLNHFYNIHFIQIYNTFEIRETAFKVNGSNWK